MNTPFWWQSKGPIAQLLRPVSIFWRLGAMFRNMGSSAEKLDVPVWCVGNVTAGGGGKTPFCLFLGEQMKQAGVNAYFISRGYGGDMEGPLLVDSEAHTSQEVGDEALLLAACLPTVVAHERIEAAKFAEEQGAELLIMDDGMQYPHLHKDKTFLLLKGNEPLGNGYMMPAGPLRESLSSALKRCDVVVEVDSTNNTPPACGGVRERSSRTGGELPNERSNDRSVSAAMPPPNPPRKRGGDVEVWQATTHITLPKLENNQLIAFAGVAHPHHFRKQLEGLGLNIVEFYPFADHHPYSKKDLQKLIERAQKENATLITTAKDAMRIPSEYKDKEYVDWIVTTKQSLDLVETSELYQMIQRLKP